MNPFLFGDAFANRPNDRRIKTKAARNGKQPCESARAENHGGSAAKIQNAVAARVAHPWRLCPAATSEGFIWAQRLGVPLSLMGLPNSATRNLPLAAHPCVGHIGLNGAVAEWLKAAVC
jgi:hypothetical protein